MPCPWAEGGPTSRGAGRLEVPLLLGPRLHLCRGAQLGCDALQHIPRLQVRKALQQHSTLGAFPHRLHLRRQRAGEGGAEEQRGVGAGTPLTAPAIEARKRMVYSGS